MVDLAFFNWRYEAYCSIKLDSNRLGPENETSPCIFSASTALLKECEDAYVPQILSVGPIHFGKENLIGMEILKTDVTHTELIRLVIKAHFPASILDIGKGEMENMFYIMMRKFNYMEDEIRHLYDKTINTDKGFLCWMMFQDACFTLEFFRCLFDGSVGDCKNLERFCHNFGSNFNPVVRSKIMKDLIKLEY
ncbi:hypothetical protein SUGI_0570340 [Cryptomeria japonica]|nr:hypothetical protein SUGI_0570340 [Cryptomeria japonica]